MSCVYIEAKMHNPQQEPEGPYLKLEIYYTDY